MGGSDGEAEHREREREREREKAWLLVGTGKEGRAKRIEATVMV